MLRDHKEAAKVVGSYQYKEGESRPKGDFYATPAVAVEKLLSVEIFGETVLEPCCGNGAISKVLEAHCVPVFDLKDLTKYRKYKVVSRDLYDWGYGETGVDFLDRTKDISVDAVVTNPPFSLSLEFTERALECTKVAKGKVAILNRIQWLEGVKRSKFFTSTPLARVYVFAKRIPRFHRYDHEGPQSTSLLAFAWFVWDWTHDGPPELSWV